MEKAVEMDWVEEDDAIEYGDKTVINESPEEPKQETETPAESSPEKKEEEAEPAGGEEGTGETPEEPEENLPFHKHPRWKAIIEDNKHKEKVIEELAAWKTKMDGYFIEEPTSTEIPAWFSKIYGDQPEVWNEYQKWDNERVQGIEQRAIEKFNQAQQAIVEKEQATENNIKSEIKKLKDEGLDFDENALKKIVLEKQLFDASGNLNFRAGYELLKISKPTIPNNPASKEAKKQVAAKMTPTSGGTPTPKDYVTAEDIRGKNWRSMFGGS